MSMRGWWGDKVIICLPSDGERRHKAWCSHYRKQDKLCLKTLSVCNGSAHCEHYECERGKGPVEPTEVPREVPVVHLAASPEAGDVRAEKPLRVVGHYATYGDKLVGKVVVVKLPGGKSAIGEAVSEDRSYIVIERDDGKRVKYDRIQSIRSKALWVTDTYADAADGDGR